MTVTPAIRQQISMQNACQRGGLFLNQMLSNVVAVIGDPRSGNRRFWCTAAVRNLSGQCVILGRRPRRFCAEQMVLKAMLLADYEENGGSWIRK